MRAAGLFFLLCAGAALSAAERLSSEIRLGNSVTAPAAYEQRWVAVASSGDEMLAVWIDQRMGRQPFAPPVVFATRISSSGEILDPYGIRLSSQAAHEPPVVAWGGDGYLVVSASWSGIYSQQIGENGRPLHEPVHIIDSGMYGEPLHLASNGNDYLLVWMNSTSTYGTWLDKTGRVIRTTELHAAYALSTTLVVHRGVYHYFHTQLETPNIGSPRGAYLTTLRDDRTVERQRIHDLTRLNLSVAAASNGEEIFVVLRDFQELRSFSIRDAHEPFVPRPFGGLLGSAIHTRVAWDGSSFLVYWTKGANQQVTDVVGMRVDRDGRAIDGAPVVLPPEASLFEIASFARTGRTGALVWRDDRFSENIDVAGIVFDGFDDLFARRGEARLIAKSARPQENVSFATDGEVVLSVWAEAGKPATIHGAFLRTGRDPGFPFLIATADEKEIRDVAVAYGSGVYVVVWETPSTGWTNRVMAARVSASGEILDSEPRQIGTSELGHDDLSLTTDGTSFIATWRTGIYTIAVAHLDAALNVKSIPFDMPRDRALQPHTPPPDPSIYRGQPRAVFDGKDFVVAWMETRQYRDPFSHLRVLHVSRDGTPLRESTAARRATVLLARDGQIIAFRVESDWNAQRTCLTAGPLDEAGVTLTCGPLQTINWVWAIPFGDGYVAVWMNYRDNQYDIQGARFTLARRSGAVRRRHDERERTPAVADPSGAVRSHRLRACRSGRRLRPARGAARDQTRVSFANRAMNFFVPWRSK